MDSELIDIYSSIISSKIKMRIVFTLKNRTLTPRQIATLIGKRINHISMYLTKLKQCNVVICLNEEKKKGRLYQLTKLGKELLIELKKNDSLSIM